jgi:predicted DNA-binding transcriptional regulator AlpA
MTSKDQQSIRYICAAVTARMMGLSVKTLEAMRAQRRGPRFYRLGRAIRYREDEVHSWFESHRDDAA